MNKLIPIALVIGMAGSQVQAEENHIQEGHQNDEVLSVVVTTGGRVNSVISADEERRTQWNRNTENIARALLPGNPIGLHANQFHGIMYQMNSGTNSERSGFHIYGGFYKDRSTERGTNVGIVVSKSF